MFLRTGPAEATMFHPICLLHGVVLGLIAAGIIALVMGTVGWLIFAVWMTSTVALYVGGWVYILMVMSEPPAWDIDFEL
jgi:hypothetical protein